MENMNQNENSFPEEMLREVRTMAGWMTFMAIFAIVMGAFGIIGNLAGLAQAPNAQLVVSILATIASIYMAVILIKKANAFRQFSFNGSSESLLEGLQAVHRYWMYSLVLMVANFIITLIF